MNLTINTNTKTNLYKPTFGRVDITKEIKRIPGVPCACCGKEVIMEELVKKAYINISKPLSQMIKKGYMEKWKSYPMLWEALNVYARINPKESLDKMLVRDEEFVLLKKAIVKDVTGDANQTTLNNSEDKKKILDIFNSVIGDSRGELKTAKTVLNKFSVFKPFLEDSHLETFELLEIYAKKHPRKTLREIVNEPSINKTHGLKNSLQKNIINLKTEYYLDEIEELINKANPIAKDELEKTKERVLNTLKHEKDRNAKVYRIKNTYYKILEKYNCENLKNNIDQYIDKIPLSYSSADLYFVTCVYKNFTDFEIINNIIQPYVSSYEHIIPKSSNGEDSIRNGLVFHTKCNKNRGKTPYTELMEYHPDMKENTIKQINYISDKLLKGKAHDYLRYWPLKVSKTLNEYTQGELAPDVTEYCKKRLKQIKRKLKGTEPKPNSDEARQINVLTKYLESKGN